MASSVILDCQEVLTIAVGVATSAILARNLALTITAWLGSQ
jgi:hypothetical protein